MEYAEKEVYFDQYCATCEYSEQPEEEEPCDECLAAPVYSFSHKPTRWRNVK